MADNKVYKLKVKYLRSEKYVVGSKYLGTQREATKKFFSVFLDGVEIGIFWADETHNHFNGNKDIDYSKVSLIWDYPSKKHDLLRSMARQKTFRLGWSFFLF